MHRATVFGRCEPTTGIDPFDRLVDEVMTTEPYATVRRVFWMVDSGCSHRGQASIDRLQDRWPKLHLIHLPVHASWLNQVEIYFSGLQRKVLSPNDFHTLDEFEARLLDFQQYYEQIATPLQWEFTEDDLNALLERIAAHEDAALTPRITGPYTNTSPKFRATTLVVAALSSSGVRSKRLGRRS